MVNYSEALKRPFTNFKALIIGIILVVIPVILGFLFVGGSLLPHLDKLMALEGVQDPQEILNILSSTILTPRFFGIAGLVGLVGLVINWIVGGYYFRCAHSVLGKTKKKFVMPKWNKVGDLFVKGLLVFLLMLIYVVITLVLGLLSILTIVGPIIFALLFIYLIPGVFISFVEDGRFGSGFKFKRIFRKAFTSKYLVTWLFGVLVTIVLGIIGGFVPFVGAPIAGFLSMVISITALTEAYSEIKK